MIEITDDGEVMVMRCRNEDGMVDVSFCAIGRYSEWPLKPETRTGVLRDWIKSRKTEAMRENEDLNRAAFLDFLGYGS